jgi:TetR/AcrR family transcriptional regulator, cholesterol catabolism regulator
MKTRLLVLSIGADTMARVTSATSLEQPELRTWQQARRDRIVRAALELLEDGDYETILIRHVAERSGFALSTLYRYFESKEQLYAAVQVEWARSLQGNLQRKPLRGEPRDRLQQLVRRVVQAFERRPQFLRLGTVLENSDDPYALALTKEVAERNYASFVEALPNLPEEVAIQVVFIVTSVLDRLLHRYARGTATVEEVLRSMEETVDFVFRGI